MGSAGSKLRSALQRGDETAALQIFEDPSLQIDPNASYGEQYGSNTPLHFAAEHGMREMFELLVKNGGNPNRKNGDGRTCLHLLCCPKGRYSRTDEDKRRAELVENTLGSAGVRVGATDKDGSTPLHLAALHGLWKVTRLLINGGAPLFAEDTAEQTACDLAAENGHTSVAELLESTMVFCDGDFPGVSEARAALMAGDHTEYRGLQAQQVVEAKDCLLVDTADMLQVPLFAAQALLRHVDWSRPALLDEWMQDRDAVCKAAGVPDLKSTVGAPYQRETSGDVECGICYGELQRGEAPDTPCGHQFCADCWRTFLAGKIQDGTTQTIECPGSDCSVRVPAEVVDHLMPRDIRHRYDNFDMKAFVESNPRMRWCPAAGCARVVELQSGDAREAMSLGVASATAVGGASENERVSARMVECGNGHFFCWDCGGTAHEPCPCDVWQRWQDKIKELKPEDTGANIGAEAESAANRVWVLSNSKPCPKCQVRIERSEGCNRMKCTKCRYDFCWMCREPWNLHSSATGGYFYCNRFEVMSKIEEAVDKELCEAETSNKELVERQRFQHFYSRYVAHQECIAIAQPLFRSADERAGRLIALVSKCNRAVGVDSSFLKEALCQLVAARHVLRASYAFGFFLDDPSSEQNFKYTIFHSLQGQLEQATERLSAMIARKCLKTPRPDILEAAVALRNRRVEFVASVQRGVLPEGIDERELDPLGRRRMSSGGRRRGPHRRNLQSLLRQDLVVDDSDEEPARECQRQGCTNPCTARHGNFCSRSCSLAGQRRSASVADFDAHLDELLRATMLLSRVEARRDSRVGDRHPPPLPPLPGRQRPVDAPPSLPLLLRHRRYSAGGSRSQEQAPPSLRDPSPPSSPTFPIMPPSPPGLIDSDDEDLRRALALSEQDARRDTRLPSHRRPVDSSPSPPLLLRNRPDAGSARSREQAPLFRDLSPLPSPAFPVVPPSPPGSADNSDDEVLRRVLALSEQDARRDTRMMDPVVSAGGDDSDEELARAITLSLMEQSPHGPSAVLVSPASNPDTP